MSAPTKAMPAKSTLLPKPRLFREITSGKTMGLDVITGRKYTLDEISVPAKTVLVLELQ